MVIYMRQPVGSCCSWRLAALAAVRNEKDAAGGEKTGGSPASWSWFRQSGQLNYTRVPKNQVFGRV